jgi:hypothetical protein
VALVLTEAMSPGQQVNDVSAITLNTHGNVSSGNNQVRTNNTNQGSATENSRTAAQITLKNISQALTRRHTSGAYTSITRSVSSVRNLGSVSQSNIRMRRAELDSHVDTCGVNNIAKVLEYTNQLAEVTGFANSLEPLKTSPLSKPL